MKVVGKIYVSECQNKHGLQANWFWQYGHPLTNAVNPNSLLNDLYLQY